MLTNVKLLSQMISNFEDIPKRIFLDSSILQTIQDYGGMLYEYESLDDDDPIYLDPKGIAKLETLQLILQVAERAPFEFALSENSFVEIRAKRDSQYLRWAYDVLDHWLTCLDATTDPRVNFKALEAIDTKAYNYLSKGDRILLRDAIALECDTFLTMENKLTKNAGHIGRTLGIRILTPIDFWRYLQPWAALFR